MQNTKLINFERGAVPFTGEDRLLVPGQRIKVGVKSRLRPELEFEDYSVLLQDEVTGSIVARRLKTDSIVVIRRESVLDSSITIYYYGTIVDEVMVFPGDVVLVSAFDGEFEAEYICAEDDHDLVRIQKISTGQIGIVSHDALSKKAEPNECVEIGEWVMIDARPYIVAMVDCESWALISAETGNRFFDPEATAQFVEATRSWGVKKDEIVKMAEKIGAEVEFCGKINVFHGEI